MSLVYDNTGDVMSYSHTLTMYRDDPARSDITFAFSRDDGDATLSIEKWNKDSENSSHVATIYEEDYDILKTWLIQTKGIGEMLVVDTSHPEMQLKVAGGKEDNLRFVKIKGSGKKVAVVLNSPQRERLVRWFNRTKA